MNQQQFQQAAGISAGLSARWYPHITAAMSEFGITAPLDQANWPWYVCPSLVVQRFIIGNDYAPYISHDCRAFSWRLHYCVWSG